MKIAIPRRDSRRRLARTRAHGSDTCADLEPGLPHRDLAHFVAERSLGLQRGRLEQLIPALALQMRAALESLLARFAALDVADAGARTAS